MKKTNKQTKEITKVKEFENVVLIILKSSEVLI